MLNHSAKRRLRNHCVRAAFVAVLFIANALQARADQSIVLRGGNGSIGSQDAQVRFLAYGSTGDITPTTQDFQSAQTGTFAYIDAPYATYIPQLSTDPLAQWIATTPALGGGSALYAIPFNVTDSVVGSASIDLGYAVDNAINGVYINGNLISGMWPDGDYHAEYRFLSSDIASLLKPNSTNWLYINVSDYGYLAALIFSANITVQGGSAATPSISPNQGGNTGQVTVRIVGSGFEPGATVTLSGSEPQINAADVTEVNADILTATVDLTNATPAVRTVTVTNPDGTSTVLENAFTVLQGGSSNVTIQKIGTPAVDGRNETFFITITNSGTVDAGATSFTELMEPWFTLVSATPMPTSQQPVGYPWGKDYNGYLEWTVPNVPAGQSTAVAYTVLLDPTMPVGDTVNGTVCEGFADASCNAEMVACLTEVVPEACVLGLLTGGPWGRLYCAAFVSLCYYEHPICETLKKGVLCSSATFPVRASVDPNDLTGPPGFGTQRWIAARQMQYTLSFNNLPTATAPVTNAVITDVIDPSTLDLSTLTVTGVVFGKTTYTLPKIPLASRPFSQDIDLRPSQNLIVRVTGALEPASNQVTVSFLSLDPATGLTPTDPLDGFLAPGVGGSVFFAVNPKPGLTTGTMIQNSGAVVFDSNPSISTNVWSNTIDNTPPVSKVSGLPGKESCNNFNVKWSGTDKGSGLGTFSLFASDNGGPFQPWLSNTTATSGIYDGVRGHTYGFYSIATDLAGNPEVLKSKAEASTKVATKGTCGPPIILAQVAGQLLSGNDLSVTLQFTNGGTSDAQSVSLNSTAFKTLRVSGKVTLSSPTLPVAEGNLASGASTTVPLILSVPDTVTKFSMTEVGTFKDTTGKSHRFTSKQVISP